MRPRLRPWILALLLCCPALAAPIVRVGYVVPSDRVPQPHWQRAAEELLREARRFYASEMEIQGFGPLTFQAEETPEGALATHLIPAALTAAELSEGGHGAYRTNLYWDRTIEAARAGGVEPWVDDEVLLLFAEAHVQEPNGGIEFRTAQGAGTPTTGVAVVSADALAVAQPGLLSDLRPWRGLVLDFLGPNILTDDAFPWYEGNAVGSLAATRTGAVAHELGHCFLLQHTYLNDANFDGLLMGNGFRGWRGWHDPASFPEEDVRLDRANACTLALSRFLRPHAPTLGDPPRIVAPTAEAEATIEATIEDGCVVVPYRVEDAGGGGIALVTLANGVGRNGVGLVAHAEWPEHPASAEGRLRTSLTEAGSADTWQLTVFDASGNTAERQWTLRIPEGANLAPAAFIRTPANLLTVGQETWFDGSPTRDPEDGAVTFSWSFGDGDSAEGEWVAHAFERAGLYEVTLRARDPEGGTGAVSQFVRVR